MNIHSTHENFKIGFDNIIKKFFILSKESEIEIGGFDTACSAIQFAISRVNSK